MSQEPSTSFSSRFKLWYTSYRDTDTRMGIYDRSHFSDEIDEQDFPIENSKLSHRMGTRLYASPDDSIPFPRECAKLIGRYIDCRKEHGVISLADDAPTQCNGQKSMLFEGCPHWALDNMAFKKKFAKRAELIDKLTYDRAMQVSDFNK
ncbi:hypothetical protein SteCoe_60 [Stentor coeruleus]|uniref:Uncharacterized protein n=1 Tax=Stentor coeruleus TaxID=5963 RepID=A0A1R2D4X1_9CILI|nr:hypothetical protein SteCoe_60 [Stentor coeruleus]